MEFWYFVVGMLFMLIAFFFGFAVGNKTADFTNNTNLTYNANIGGKEKSDD